ncbi:ADP-ribose pyrophosphatase YjhB (NUDIX family) [Chitinivorax tropicus]|uniref:Phosphatase NudJ n=1 Tax=Chitinivorax tropicus TaxID=714531 RepID=A0A840MJE0_9PROT|nr:NUDIX hydrolase [Chitinivorax tropicus]MBB5018530.1 ADP-ribose pyrophosphatase YjhB (NUDIX family) [Chitinivorax tropicus]
MTEVRWKPNVTVAAVIERDGRFLLVKEQTAHGIRFNQPAGHLDEGESLPAACQRETREETAWQFQPQALLGVYLMPVPEAELTYLRFAFCGELLSHDPLQALDEGIIEAVWMTWDEIQACADQHRSPLVLRCVEDYLSGRRYPLSVLTTLLPS